MVLDKYLMKFFRGKGNSYGATIWKYILDHRNLIKKGLCWTLGNGKRLTSSIVYGWGILHL